MVSLKKTILILIDEAESTAKMAKEISLSLKGHKVVTRTGAVFEGTDLLPADVLFIGCEKPDPPSFGYAAKLFKHINLAGRLCGIFSAGSAQAVKYLSRLTKDSELSVCGEPLLASENKAASSWASAVLEKK